MRRCRSKWLYGRNKYNQHIFEELKEKDARQILKTYLLSVDKTISRADEDNIISELWYSDKKQLDSMKKMFRQQLHSNKDHKTAIQEAVEKQANPSTNQEQHLDNYINNLPPKLKLKMSVHRGIV
jgi:hypothetical protein